jgi:Domain of unknown function (DUF6362)
MDKWTPSLVEARLAEAAFVLKRLPEPRRQGHFSTWPEIVHSFPDKVGQEPKPMRVLPSPQAISRTEETLTWTACLDPVDGKIVWMRAHGERWKTICWTVGLQPERSGCRGRCLDLLADKPCRKNRRRNAGRHSFEKSSGGASRPVCPLLRSAASEIARARAGFSRSSATSRHLRADAVTSNSSAAALSLAMRRRLQALPIRHSARARPSASAPPRRNYGELLDAVAADLPGLLRVLRRHRIPGEDVEQLVRQIEVAPARHLVAIDQHYVQLRQTAGGTRDSLEGIDHEHENAELALHHLGQTPGRHVAQIELGREALASLHRILETRMARQAEGAAQQWARSPNLGSDRPEGCDPAARIALIGAEHA